MNDTAKVADMSALVDPKIDPASVVRVDDPTASVTARNVDVYYGDKHAIKDLSVDIPARAVTAFIGPSGCGKSTFLRCINRMNDTIPICRVTGDIKLDGLDIYDRSLDVCSFARASAWCSRSRTPSRNRSMRMSPTGADPWTDEQ